nr:hypothetical protein [Candidatus Sigynarchaeota archaeon]
MATPVPFTVSTLSGGRVRIEKRSQESDATCCLYLALILSLVVAVPLGFTIPPGATVAIVIILLFFVCTPIYTLKKQWLIEIDNAHDTLYIIRWHKFNAQQKHTISINYAIIKEIVSETSETGSKRRFMVVTTAGARHLLYASMNMNHANKFIDEFMRAIRLPQASQSASVAIRPPSNPVPTSSPSTPTGIRPLTAADYIARDFAPSVNDDVDDVDDDTGPGHTATIYPQAPPPPSSTVKLPAEPSRAPAPPASDAGKTQVQQSLEEIARKKHDMLARMYEPQTTSELQAKAREAGNVPEASKEKQRRASEHLRNVEGVDAVYERSNLAGAIYPHEPSDAEKSQMPAGMARDSLDGGKSPKKKEEEEEAIVRQVDKKVEKELAVQKVKQFCIVCNVALKGTAYICPTCDTKYCIRCAKALSERKERCWTCRKPIKV